VNYNRIRTKNDRKKDMKVQDLIHEKSELTHGKSLPEPIVLSTRIRLARNLEGYNFPDWSNIETRKEVLRLCSNEIIKLKAMKVAEEFDCDQMTETEKRALVERHLISPEFAQMGEGSGVLINEDQSIAVMINEEDHLRIQVLRRGYQFKSAWQEMDELDNQIDERLDYAFSGQLGYLTACPTNLGTGMRASIMLHLPGLVIVGQIEKVIRACSHLNLAVRGIYGEGSDAIGSIFQISNQQTLGESEVEIIKKLTGVLDTVIEQEKNVRNQILAQERVKIFDKIGRAFGILRNAHSVTSDEAMNLLSLMRLAVDLGILPSQYRTIIDSFLIESQPAHIQLMMGEDIKLEHRDSFRAMLLKQKFKEIDSLNFDNIKT